MTSDPTDRMTPEDRRAWEAVQQWKTKRLHSSSDELVPTAWRERAKRVSAKAREKASSAAAKTPRADDVAAAFRKALEGRRRACGTIPCA